MEVAQSAGLDLVSKGAAGKVEDLGNQALIIRDGADRNLGDKTPFPVI